MFVHYSSWQQDHFYDSMYNTDNLMEIQVTGAIVCLLYLTFACEILCTS